MSAREHNQVYDTYLVYLHEEVTGLSVQSPVRYNGVPVGFVKNIGLVPSNPQLVKVTLDIEQGTPVNTSTVATLMSQGITGVDYVGLQSQEVNAPPLASRGGDQYPIIPSKPSLLMQLSKVMPEITRKISVLSDSITKLFDQKNRNAFSASLQNIQDFTSTLKSNSARLTNSLDSLQTILKRGRVATKNLPALVEQAQTTLRSVDKTAGAVSKTAGAFAKTAHTGRVAINNLSQQLMPTAQQTMQKLTDAATNLQMLSNELRHNPSMLVRGKVPARLGPGER